MLDQSRVNEIAFKALVERMKMEGLKLSPKTVKRDVHNFSKELGITILEAKECVKIMFKIIYEETLKEIEEIK